MTGPVAPAPDPFVRERPRLWTLAYRMTGSRADADDVVQDAWLRWRGADEGGIERPEAWLTTVTTRLALDRLRARQRRREEYVGPWLPEPVAAAPGRTPDEAAELADSLTYGFLVLLERLEPVERVVFLLADVFGEPYSTIAEAVGRSEVACRQIAHRARQRVRRDVPRRTVSPSEPARLAGAFAEAAYRGNLDALTQLLSPDVVLTSDGGPRQRAARVPVVGADRVARLLIHLTGHVPPGATQELTRIDGDEAIVIRTDGRAFAALVLETAADRQHIERVYLVVNPDKLAHL